MIIQITNDDDNTVGSFPTSGMIMRGFTDGVSGGQVSASQHHAIDVGNATFYIGTDSQNRMLVSSNRAQSDAMPLKVFQYAIVR